MKALIFAAGLGTRLRPLTDTIPKALVPVAGVPMLERIILKLKAAGISEIVVNTHHLASQIADFLSVNSNFGCSISISHEEGGPFETGGGIRHAAPLLSGKALPIKDPSCKESSGKEPSQNDPSQNDPSPNEPSRFLVHNADILSNLDLSWLIRSDDPKALATLVVTDANVDRYLLFDSSLRLVGWINSRTGEVRSPYPSLDPSQCRRLSFCGVSILSERVLELMKDWPQSFSIIDFFLWAADKYPIRALYAPDLQIIDIGSPEALRRANEEFGRTTQPAVPRK